ncbi:MAG: triple tyrosine motif-containing protein [Bacteroidota bacterium]
MRITVIYCFILLFTVKIHAQEVPELGVPYLDVYMPEHYQNAGKIWDIQSNNQNVLFLASDKGLLEFDGSEWKKYKGSKGYTRSLQITSDSILYTGSDLDFGKWELNSLLYYEYESLYPFKENGGKIAEEFWGVHQISDYIIFISFDNIYVYKDDQLTKISAPSKFSKSFFTNGFLYVVDEKFGLYSFDGISLEPVFSFQENRILQIVGINKIDNKLLIVTQNQGLYVYEESKLNSWSNDLSDFLIRDQAFSFTTINEEYFVFGTILNGIYITDTFGRIIQNINKQRGLPNNTILDLYYSPNGILWVSMDLGLTGIQLSQNLAYVFDHAGNFGTGQTAIIDNDVFYLGTNQGLYTSPWGSLASGVQGISFSLMPGSAGQVWDITRISDDILCGHDRGLYRIGNNAFLPIRDQIGVLDLEVVDDTRILVGTYNGIHLYEKKDDEWLFVHELDLIKGGCSQILLTDDLSIWVLIPNYGIVHSKLNSTYDIDDRTIYPLEDFVGEMLLLEKGEDGIYLVTDQKKYKLEPENNGTKEVVYNYHTEMVKHRLPANYVPISFNDSMQFYPVYNGFAIKTGQSETIDISSDTLLLRKFEVFNIDTAYRYSYLDQIPYDANNLKIDFMIPHKENVTYRYHLEGFMEKWSEWSDNSEFELLNLREGDYTLRIEGKVDNGSIYASILPFTIKAPWYRSIFAYLCYFLLFLLVVYSLYRWQEYKLEDQKQRLLFQEQVSLRLQADAYKKESIVKRQQELEEQIKELEKELRSTKIQLVIKAKDDEDKKRLIERLTEKLRKMQNNEAGKGMKMKELFRLIDSHQDRESNTFQIHMDELNQVFTQKLKTEFPSLTMYDLRLCTYIKMGLSTREIAEMMHVLPSSINVSRSRLRKKLGLEAKEDLFSFLEAI